MVNISEFVIKMKCPSMAAGGSSGDSVDDSKAVFLGVSFLDRCDLGQKLSKLPLAG